MKRVEAARFQSAKQSNGEAIRVALTKPSGEERQEVIMMQAKDLRVMDRVEAAIEAILKEHGSIGIAAASKALWKRLEGKKSA